MRLARFKRVIVILGLIPLLAAITVMAADDRDLSFTPEDERSEVGDLPTARDNQPDTVFIDIKMANGTVVGQDTYGNWWQYDFENREFIPFRPDQTVENSLAEPVEDRCTRRKRVRVGTYDDVLIGFEEYVEGDVIALRKIVISGWVKGDVQSFFGEVIVNTAGQVDGEIKAPQVLVKPGGVVSGETFITDQLNLSVAAIAEQAMPILIVITLVFLFVGFLLVSLMPRQLAVVGACMTNYKSRSVLVGLLTALIIAPIAIAVLALTVIGWMIVPVAGMVAVAMGLVSYGNQLGTRILAWRNISLSSMMIPSLLGMSVFSLLWLGAVWLAVYPTALVQALGVLLLFLVLILTAYPLLSGLGAALLTRFGYNEYVGLSHSQRDEIQTPAPPPLPESPPVIPSSGGKISGDFRPSGSTPPLSSDGE